MNGIMTIAFWSRALLLYRPVLWMLFWVNLLGTAYGYEWYWDQMVDTIATKPLWMVIMVPDSPTASLFFTISVLWLLIDSKRDAANGQASGSPVKRERSLVRSVVETVGAVASFKYGIWAVVMIVSGGLLGDSIGWQDWMLSTSHLGMAVEALLYLRFFRVTWRGLLIGALWVFGNDIVDYTFDVFPWLPYELVEHIQAVHWFTVLLSALSLIVIGSTYRIFSARRV